MGAKNEKSRNKCGFFI